MSRRKPWQRPGGDVRAVDQAARNQQLAEQLQEANDDRRVLRHDVAALTKRLEATASQIEWHQREVKRLEAALADAEQHGATQEKRANRAEGALAREREWHAGQCSHVVELRAEREHARKQEKLIGQLQEINENYGRMELAAIEADMAMSGGKRGRR